MRIGWRPLFLVFLLLLISSITARELVEGVIRDADSRKPLPAANIQIEGTYQGTISSDDGEFGIYIDQFPATLRISYIGYSTARVTLNAPSQNKIEILLKPIAYELPEIVVSGEDPAVRIMREVIRRKNIWRAKLNTYIADAYTRVVLENDSGIVSVQETISRAYWDRKRGSRELILSRRQTDNILEKNNFAGASYVANFYDDDIRMMLNRFIGPTNPKALNFYDFKLTGQRKLDNKIVYDIKVTPKTKLQPTFSGSISVLDEDFAMIEVHLKPGKGIVLPPMIQKWDVTYNQQFSNFGKNFWLPVDIRIDGDVRIGFIGLKIPDIKYRQRSRLSDYQLNVSLPDSLYRQKKLLQVDSSSVKKPGVFAKNSDLIPLSREEKTAYADIDSSYSFRKAYKPTGPLARFVKFGNGASVSIEPNPDKFTGKPDLAFNRVDGGHFGLQLETNPTNDWKIYGKAAYNSASQRGSFGGGVSYRFSRKHRGYIKLDYSTGSQSRYISPVYSRFTNSVGTFFGGIDYFDYFWNKSLKSSVKFGFPKIKTYFTGSFLSENHSSLSKNSDFSLFNFNKNRRKNPPIPEGNLRSLRFDVEIGDEFNPTGIAGQRRLAISVETSSPNLFSSDFSFTRYHLQLDLQFLTFLKRRFMPNTLDIRIIAGTSAGKVPPQRYGILDGRNGFSHPFGTFNTLVSRPYEGDQYFGIFWEHNFRSVPFELLGLNWFTRRNMGIIVHGASGRSWVTGRARSLLSFEPRVASGYRHELGVSLNGIFNIFRVDFTRRLDKSDFSVGIGIARWF